MNFTVEGQINVGMGTNSVPSPELKKIFSELRTIDFTSYRFIKDSKGQPIGIELNVHNPAIYHELVETKKESGMLIDIVNGKIVISAIEIKEDKVEDKPSIKDDEQKSKNESTESENKVAEIKPLQPELNDGLTEEEKSSAKNVDIVNNKLFKLKNVDIVISNKETENEKQKSTGKPSTIVKYENGKLTLLREGNISFDEIMNNFK